MNDNDNSGIGGEAAILIKIYKALPATKKNLQKLMFPIIKSFDHEGRKVISVIFDMTVVIFEHFVITS